VTDMHSSIDPAVRLRGSELGGLTLTEFRQPPGLNVPKHSHECATILIVLEGLAADRIAGHVHECNPSTILIRPAGEPHTHHYGREGAHCLVVEVKPESLKAVRKFSQVLDCAGGFHDGLLSELAMRLYVESRIMDSASELAIEGLALEMLARATRLMNSKNGDSAAQPRWLSQAVDFIRENYAQPLGLSQIASAVGVHPAHLAEVFRKHHGCSIGQYIRQLRLDHAAREVMFSENSLADISAAAGFYDQSHFTKFFKRYAGMTPSEMRAITRLPKVHTKSR
jgi:AraC family transcriptional regulator